MEAGLAIYDRNQHESLGIYYGLHDAASCALTLVPLALWNMGRIDEARRRLDAAVAHAHQLTVPANIADAYSYCAFDYCLLRDPVAAQNYATPALRSYREQGMLNAQYLSTAALGWSLAMQGQVEEGVALVQQGINLCKQSHQRLHMSQLICMFGEAYLAGGHPIEALEAVDEGIDLFHRYRDLICAPDLYLLKGQALLALGAGDDRVEAAYSAALSLARELGAKVSELRAATSLARLRQHEGRSAEGLQLLQPVYTSFAEGFDTPDLLAAATLLEELKVQ
jgi:tetratricopeptide (TPR) repeat protein